MPNTEKNEKLSKSTINQQKMVKIGGVFLVNNGGFGAKNGFLAC